MKKTILIIDDDVNIAQLLSDKLEHAQYETIVATNGETGLEIALQKHPTLILLDIKMPKMDGLTTLKKLRQNSWGKNVPILILSNLDSPDYVSDALKEMATDYLTKSDWSLESIVKRIKEQIG